MKTIKPAPTKLFCRVQPKNDVTKSGIVIPESVELETRVAEVINYGKDVPLVRTHDIIAYNQQAASEIKLNNNEYIIIDHEDILGVLVEVDEA